MKAAFYEKPSTLSECCSILEQFGGESRLLAGGTDLIPQMRTGVLRVKRLVDLACITDLTAAYTSEGKTFLGSMLRLSDVQKKRELACIPDILRICAGHVSSMQIRNCATLGGNSCNASPSADTVPGLLLLDAEAQVISSRGTRTIPMTDFFLKPGKTTLNEDEILCGFVFDIPDEKNTGMSYCKYTIRGDSDITLVGAAAALTLDSRDKILVARLALASVAPTPLRLQSVEALLEGEIASQGLFEEAADLCAKTCSPISDQRATAEYRREMARIWVVRALSQAFEKSRGLR